MDGTRIPRLADLFAMVREKGDQRVRFNIEIKTHPAFPDETLAPEPFAQALIAEIRKAGMGARATIQSFDWRALQAAQRIAPEIPTVYLSAQQTWLDNIAAAGPEASRWTAGFQLNEHGSVPAMVKAAGGAVWSPYYGDLDAEKMQIAKAARAQSRGLDGQRCRGRRAHARPRRGRDHHRPAGPDEEAG